MLTSAKIRADEPESPSLKLGEIFASIYPHLKEVDERLNSQFKMFEPGVAEYVQYAISSQGKRLRPALAIIAAGASGGIKDGHYTLGVIMEMIHLATLVHDDILDGAMVRRNQPTAAAKWGIEISVLLGDCLFAHSLKLAATFPTTEICRKTAEATNVVCSGEIIQTQRRFDFSMGIPEYLKIIEMKTAALFEVAMELSAYLNDAPQSVRWALRDYGLNLGIAYQIYDDLLDVFGKERTVGKSLGTDFNKGKLTLPFLILLDQSSRETAQKVEKLFRNHDETGSGQAINLLFEYRCLPRALDMLDSYVSKAKSGLSLLPDDVYRNRLSQLADFLSQESHLLLSNS